jgi:hypothetical protein
MKKTLQMIGLSMIVVGLALAMFGLIIFGNTLPFSRTYDCGMAEFHPDYPAKVKEECRKMRSSKITT